MTIGHWCLHDDPFHILTACSRSRPRLSVRILNAMARLREISALAEKSKKENGHVSESIETSRHPISVRTNPQRVGDILFNPDSEPRLSVFASKSAAFKPHFGRSLPNDLKSTHPQIWCDFPK
jgi:hypothetical protein